MKTVRTLMTTALGFVGSLALAPLAFAQDAAMQVAAEAPSPLFLAADILNLSLIAVAIILLVLIIGRYGASELSTIFTAFVISTALLGACRLFILLASYGIYELTGDRMAFAWHILFYLAMATMILGARSLVNLASKGASNITNRTMIIWGAVCAAILLFVFLGTSSIVAFYDVYLADSSIEAFGGIHFIAFAMGGIAAFYVFQRTRVGSITQVISVPLLICLGLMGLQHFWELCVESWKLIDVAQDVIEEVELLFVVPAYSLLVYTFLRLYRVMSRPS